VVFAEGGVEAVGTYDDLWNISPTFRKLNALHIAEKPKMPAKAKAEEQEEELLAPAVGM
jgi:hypothetical protein